MKHLSLIPVPFIVLLVLSGCGGSGGGNGTCDPTANECEGSFVCDVSTDGLSRCVAPVTIVGTVLALAHGAPNARAGVQAADNNGAAGGTTADRQPGRVAVVVFDVADDPACCVDAVFEPGGVRILRCQRVVEIDDHETGGGKLHR